MRTLHRTSLNFVRLIPSEAKTSYFDHDERENRTYKLQSSPDLPAGMDYPPATGRLAAHTSTIATLRTTFRTRLGLELDPKVPFLRHSGSAAQPLANPRSPHLPLPSTYQSQGMIVNHLIQIMWCPRILSWEPCLDQRCPIITLHEMLFEPRQR